MPCRQMFQLGFCLATLLLCAAGTAHAADPPIQLKIVGGLGGVSQYTDLEAPFWTRDVPRLTGGRVEAEIHPFDRSGLAAREMLQLMHLGVVPFGSGLLAEVSADEPELNAVDLPALNPDMATLRQTVSLYRQHLQDVLQRNYGIKLLAIYAYPAQVLWCTKPFVQMQDLAGRRVRTSSVSQSEMMSALHAVPVVIPFSEIVSSIRNNVVDCAITGTMSGNLIGLPEVTSYISPMAISWGLSFFGANQTAWDELPPDIQTELEAGIKKLEAAIWSDADAQTAEGLACDTGQPSCVGGRQYHMHLVTPTPQDDERRRQLLTETILPKWIERCGTDCVAAWNDSLAHLAGVRAPNE